VTKVNYNKYVQPFIEKAKISCVIPKTSLNDADTSSEASTNSTGTKHTESTDENTKTSTNSTETKDSGITAECKTAFERGVIKYIIMHDLFVWVRYKRYFNYLINYNEDKPKYYSPDELIKAIKYIITNGHYNIVHDHNIIKVSFENTSDTDLHYHIIYIMNLENSKIHLGFIRKIKANTPKITPKISTLNRSHGQRGLTRGVIGKISHLLDPLRRQTMKKRVYAEEV
jgi:hypothetical protein